jgi:hypothetical protein
MHCSLMTTYYIISIITVSYYGIEGHSAIGNFSGYVMVDPETLKGRISSVIEEERLAFVIVVRISMLINVRRRIERTMLPMKQEDFNILQDTAANIITTLVPILVDTKSL